MSGSRGRTRDRQGSMQDDAAMPLMNRAAIAALQARVAARVIGGGHLVRGLITALLADGHVLIDGPPGFAKTRAVTALADALEVTFRRVVLGPGQRMAHIFGAAASVAEPLASRGREPDTSFANILLAEGLDGAAPEVRLALLDAMTERQVVIDGITIRSPGVFFVCATRTMAHGLASVETLGPGERDRFLLHLRVAYPDEAQERRMLDLLHAESAPAATRTPTRLPLATIIAARAGVHAVRTGPRPMRWITALVGATRSGDPTGNGPARWIRGGVGPRGSIALERCARAHAWLSGRRQVSERDIVAVAHDVLRHRLDLSDAAKDAGITADAVITELLALNHPR